MSSAQHAARAVLVLAGASSGICAAAAQLLAARGFRVWGTSRSAQPERDGVVCCAGIGV